MDETKSKGTDGDTTYSIFTPVLLSQEEEKGERGRGMMTLDNNNDIKGSYFAPVERRAWVGTLYMICIVEIISVLLSYTVGWKICRH